MEQNKYFAVKRMLDDVMALEQSLLVVKAELQAIYDEKQDLLIQKMNRPIDDLPISALKIQGLKDIGVETYGDLSKIYEGDFLRVPWIGRKCLNFVKEHLEKQGHVGIGRYQWE